MCQNFLIFFPLFAWMQNIEILSTMSCITCNYNVNLIATQLKILNKDKLHLSRRPVCTAWLLLGLSTVIFVGIFKCLTSNIYFLIVLLLGEIMFWLDCFGEWEDLKLYMNENKAVVEKSVWSDKLCLGKTGEFSLMKLTDIRHVGVSTEMGIFIIHRNGKIITFNVTGLTRKETEDLRKDINYFLNMSRLKYLNHSLADSSDRLLLPSGSEEYLQNVRRTNLPMSNEITVSDNILTSSKIYHQMQQNLSYPSLMPGTQPNSYQSSSLKRGPYTENSACLNYVKYTKNICAICTPCDSELNKEYN